GVPPAYQPGRTYELVVALKRAGMLRSGFQTAARLAEGQGAGMQAGAFAPSDGGTQVIRDSGTGVAYVQHTQLGSAATGGTARWSVLWTAPPRARGPVVFHIAANAANDDDSPLSDYIYTTEIRTTPGPRP
ncbi:MAG: choice-of-anchor V domain-containing protein, partial [Gemmatimonadales bacterium]